MLKSGSDIGDVVAFIKEYRRTNGNIVGAHVPRPGGDSGSTSGGNGGGAAPLHGLVRQSSILASGAAKKAALKSGFLCVRASSKNLFGRWSWKERWIEVNERVHKLLSFLKKPLFIYLFVPFSIWLDV